MTALYELTGKMKELSDMSGEAGMEVAILDTLESIEIEFNEKAENIIKLVENRSSDISAIDNEIKRLSERKSKIVKFQDGMKDYLKQNMEASGIKKITCPLFTITLRDGMDKVKINDEESLPDDYVSINIKTSPDKRKILKDLKNGINISGASMIKSEKTILIK